MNTKKKWLLSILLFVTIAGSVFTVLNTMKYVKGTSAQKPLIKAVANKPKQSSDRPSLYTQLPEKGEQMGELVIPKLNSVTPIYHGTDEDELDKGIGHFSGSVLPGEPDNAVLSGHRDTVFRKLGSVGKNDLLIVRTSKGKVTYKVRKVRIVDANDRTVIVPKPKATLTVTTCYPFNYIGNAPQRYILVADLVKP